MTAHFYDLDILLEINNRVWIVDKTNPQVPLIYIRKADFELIKSGIYRSQNNLITFNGCDYYISNSLMNQLKILSKKSKINITNFAFSLQEFLNPDVIKKLDYNIKLNSILSLKNTSEDIYVICSKVNRINYDKLINDLKEQLAEQGLKIKNFYYITDSIYNITKDQVKYNTTKVLLQHLIGYKTEGSKFINEEVERYDDINYYNNEATTLYIADDINNDLLSILEKTESGLSSVIAEDIDLYKPKLTLNKVNDNSYNSIESKSIDITYNVMIKKFEGFKTK